MLADGDRDADSDRDLDNRCLQMRNLFMRHRVRQKAREQLFREWAGCGSEAKTSHEFSPHDSMDS